VFPTFLTWSAVLLKGISAFGLENSWKAELGNPGGDLAELPATIVSSIWKIEADVLCDYVVQGGVPSGARL
jgi:hypothetical protein